MRSSRADAPADSRFRDVQLDSRSDLNPFVKAKSLDHAATLFIKLSAGGFSRWEMFDSFGVEFVGQSYVTKLRAIALALCGFGRD